MRRLSCVLFALLLSPIALAAQDAAPFPSPSLSLSTGGGATFPRLGVWIPLNGRLTLGLEAEGAFQSSSVFQNGNQTKGVTHRDWRLTVGPAASLRVASFGPISLLASAGATYGIHAFDVREGWEDRSGPAARGFGAWAGVGLDWQASDHWAVGLLYQGRWTSEPGFIGAMPRDAWRGPTLGMSVKFRF